MPSPLSPSKSTLVLVTGATGWVGGHVCRALLDRGYSVRAAVRDPAAEAKVKFLTDMGCELVRVPDLLGDEGWEAAMAGCDGLAHVASGEHRRRRRRRLDEGDAVEGTSARPGPPRRLARWRVVVTATMASVSARSARATRTTMERGRPQRQAGLSVQRLKTAAEARTWELAEEHKEKFAVTTVHPAVVIGTLCPASPCSRRWAC